METVTTLPRSRPLTVDDLEAMPDDGHRYELIDGTLIVSPAPTLRHQMVSGRLHHQLAQACPADLLVLAAPTDVRLTVDTLVQPDLLVIPRSAVESPERPLRPLLVVEILSPSTRHVDLALKRSRYEAAGLPAYWVVDPDALELIAWELRDGEYVEAGRATEHETYAAARPFDVEIVPAHLVR